MRAIHWVIPALLVCAPLFAQTAAPKLEFEVASVRPAGPTPPAALTIGLHIDGAQLTTNYLSLRDYLGMATRLRIYQIVGPDWIATDRFDIAAKLPGGAKRADVPAMLLALLEERFQMKTHRESRDFPVYALTMGKGVLKMKESPIDADDSGSTDPNTGPVNVSAHGDRNGTIVNLGRGASFTFGNNKFEARKLSMLQLADMLSRFLDKPVVDQTQLPGTFDFSLEVAPEDFTAMQIRAAIAAGIVLPPEAMRLLETSSGDTLFASVQTLGLKLESKKAPLEVLVVDRAEKTPTAN